MRLSGEERGFINKFLFKGINTEFVKNYQTPEREAIEHPSIFV